MGFREWLKELYSYEIEHKGQDDHVESKNFLSPLLLLLLESRIE